MNLKSIATVLLFAAVNATPASANWFDNFMVGESHKTLIGAATTPDDLRAIGDSGLGTGKTYRFDPKSGHYHEVRPGRDDKQPAQGPSGSASTPADSRAGVFTETRK